jgi:ketosteroid isomerase-like protein
MPARSELTQTVHDFFDHLHNRDLDAWGDLWAETGRIVVPYPPEGFPDYLQGKSEITTAFRKLFASFKSFDSEITALYPIAGLDAVCVEYSVRATLVGGSRYTNRNIAVFRFDDGLIGAYHDYFDPRRFQAVVDALPTNAA